MHSRETVAAVLRLKDAGLNNCEISRRTGISRPTIRDWSRGRLPHSYTGRPGSPGKQCSPWYCSQCGGNAHHFDQLSTAYAYLLGLYLGDGCISAHQRGIYRLRIFLDMRYPGIVRECEAAMRAVLPRNRVGRQLRSCNCYEVYSYSKGWPCLFPQHGYCKKHLRPIELAEWQREFVELVPHLFLRGLIHSDGCRFQNSGRGGWACPRYRFDNFSTDILRLFCDACELLDLHWTASGRRTIYVSRKADVARLDKFVGPKA